MRRLAQVWDGMDVGERRVGLALTLPSSAPNSWGSLLASLSLTPPQGSVLTQETRIRRYPAVGLISSGW